MKPLALFGVCLAGSLLFLVCLVSPDMPLTETEIGATLFVIMGLMPFLIFFGGIIEVARIILAKQRPKWLPRIYWPVSIALSIAGLPPLLTFLFIL